MKIKLAMLERESGYLNRMVSAFGTKFADKLEIYTDNMALYATCHGTGSARSALTREDGSVLLAAADSTRLYLP